MKASVIPASFILLRTRICGTHTAYTYVRTDVYVDLQRWAITSIQRLDLVKEKLARPHRKQHYPGAETLYHEGFNDVDHENGAASPQNISSFGKVGEIDNLPAVILSSSGGPNISGQEF